MPNSIEIKSFKDLIVWQKSVLLVTEIYKVSTLFPDAEKFGLVIQIRRAAVSIPSNIAEGTKRVTAKDYANFLHIALGSLAEVETQLEIAIRLEFITQEQCLHINTLIVELQKMLNTLIKKLK